MSEKPIGFKSLMVKAIRGGQKTQTRRIVNMDNLVFSALFDPGDMWKIEDIRQEAGEWSVYTLQRSGKLLRAATIKCPYGSVGDRLYVKETYATCVDIDWRKDPARAKRYTIYQADGEQHPSHEDHHHDFGEKWKSGRFMPRCLSRIDLEIMNIRCQRLQDITDADATAEGMRRRTLGPREAFAHLWVIINGNESWESNQFVWAITFKVLTP